MLIRTTFIKQSFILKLLSGAIFVHVILFRQTRLSRRGGAVMVRKGTTLIANCMPDLKYCLNACFRAGTVMSDHNIYIIDEDKETPMKRRAMRFKSTSLKSRMFTGSLWFEVHVSPNQNKRQSSEPIKHPLFP